MAAAALRLSDALLREIEAHGEAGYPDEVCGFLVGRTQAGGAKIVTRLLAIDNAWDDASTAASITQETPEFATQNADFLSATRRRRFVIPPEQYYAADRATRAEGLSVLGFYHSHPDHPARPSRYDLALAQEIFPGYSYIIVAVKNGKADETTSWVLRDDMSDFDAEPMETLAAEAV